jgi:hypothetical protein
MTTRRLFLAAILGIPHDLTKEPSRAEAVGAFEDLAALTSDFSTRIVLDTDSGLKFDTAHKTVSIGNSVRTSIL